MKKNFQEKDSFILIKPFLLQMIMQFFDRVLGIYINMLRTYFDLLKHRKSIEFIFLSKDIYSNEIQFGVEFFGKDE
jgi:hypothetical protein